jgi:hypothetical protein
MKGGKEQGQLFGSDALPGITEPGAADQCEIVLRVGT